MRGDSACTEFRRKVLCNTLIVALAASAAMTSVYAQAQVKSFDVPMQPAASGLNAFAEQADITLVFSQDLVSGVTTKPLKGSYSVTEGLDRMLEGTRLSHRLISENTVVISTRSSDAVAVNDQQESTSSLTRNPSASESPSEPSEDKITTLEGMVVTGSRLQSEGESPVTVFDEERIDELGVHQVADVLHYLPQQSFQSSETSSFGASRSVQLRGLGLGTTLVLINGRRTVTSALQGTRNAFDLNMLPLAAVDRVEVLTESASSIYGADAIGGVLNVILKGEVERPTADVSYGAANGGGEEQQASLALSLPLGRLRNIVVFDYFERDPLFGRERDYTNDADFRRFGATDQRVQTANPGNVCSVDFGNLPGLSAPCAAVPAGSSGVGLTPGDFAATAGQTNLYSPYVDLSIIPGGKRHSFFARFEFDLSPDVSAFGEFMYVDREDDHIQPAPSVDFGYVPETNPFNPFGVPVYVNYMFDLDAFGPTINRFESQAWRVVGGLEGQFDKGGWEAAVLYTHDEGSNHLENGLDSAALDAALAESDPALAFNPFQDGPGGSPGLLASLRDENPAVDRLTSEALQGSAFIRRELFELPGGAVEAVVGGEARNESIGIHSEMFDIALDAERDTLSGFFEVRAPLIGPDQDSPLGDRLTLTASGRFDHYSDFGGTFNPRIGALWAPTGSLLFRGSYATSFRAPALFELFLPPTFIPGIPLSDPRRSGEIALVDITLSGNPDLDAENAKSFNAGFLFTPAWAKGLSLGATYWSIRQEQRVVRTDLFLLLQNEDFFPDLIVRAEPTPADIAAGLPGRLLAINSMNINSGEVETSGIDFDVSFGSIDTDVGRFAPSLTATWVNSYEAADFPFSANTERVGLAQSSGSIPEWRAVGTLAWSYGGFGAAVTARYASSYDDIDFFGEPTGKRLDPPILVDLQLSWNAGEAAHAGGGLLDGLILRAGATNLFDEDPPFTEVQGAYGFDPSQFEIRGRFLYLKVTKAF